MRLRRMMDLLTLKELGGGSNCPWSSGTRIRGPDDLQAAVERLVSPDPATRGGRRGARPRWN
jgi:hypothetical protein